MDSSTLENLLALSREGDRVALGALLEEMRPFMKLMAARGLDANIQVRVDPSDVVQTSCLEAVRDFPMFRGATSAELAGWLRQIVSHNVGHAMEKHIIAQKRSMRKERSLDDTAAGAPLKAALTDRQSSPSQRIMRGETAILLAHHLEKLTTDQQEAIRLRYVEGLSLAQLAKRLERSEEAVAGLLKRGLRALRESFSH